MARTVPPHTPKIKISPLRYEIFIFGVWGGTASNKLNQDSALIPNPRTKWDPNPTLTLTISPLCFRKCLSRGMQAEPNPTLTLTISPLFFRKVLPRGGVHVLARTVPPHTPKIKISPLRSEIFIFGVWGGTAQNKIFERNPRFRR